MKVLWFSNGIISKESSKGSGSWLHAMRDLLAPEVELINITKGASGDIEYHLGNGVKEYILPSWPLYDGVPSAENINKIASIINDEKPDIIHIWGVEQYWAVLFCRGYLSHRNVLLEIQGVVSSCATVFWGGLSLEDIKKCKSFREIVFPRKEGSLMWNNREFLNGGKREIDIIRGFQRIATQSDWTRNQILPFISDGTKLYNSLRPLRNNFLVSRKWERHLHKSPRLFTSISYYLPLKGLHVLFIALSILKKEYPGIKLYVAGPDLYSIQWYKINGYQKFLINLIEDNNLQENIIFTGRLDADGLIEQLLESDIFVNSSFVESYSASLAEALCLGVPCVCSYAGAMPEFSKFNEVAVYYTPYDFCTCAESIRSLFIDERKCELLSVNAISHISEICGREAVIKRQLETYNNIVG